MDIDVHLIEVATGRRAVYETPTYDQPKETREQVEHGVRWMWSEGNYGCDCNRALFFYRALGEEDPEDGLCRDGERYRVEKIVERGTDRIIYADPEKTTMSDTEAPKRPAKPFSAAHMNAVKALWRHQVEAGGYEWNPDIPIPDTVYAEAAVVMGALTKPTKEMVKAMVAPIADSIPPFARTRAAVIKQAEEAVTGTWIDGIMSALGKKPETTKPKPKLIIHPGGQA